MEALKLEPELDSWCSQDGATITEQDGNVLISVAEEQDLYDYNSLFTCNITITKNQAIALRDWLETFINQTPPETS